MEYLDLDETELSLCVVVSMYRDNADNACNNAFFLELTRMIYYASTVTSLSHLNSRRYFILIYQIYISK